MSIPPERLLEQLARLAIAEQLERITNLMEKILVEEGLIEGPERPATTINSGREKG